MAEATDKVTLLYDWLTDCDKENIILCFKGDFNQDLVNAIVMLTEQEPDVKNSSTLVRTRVFSVLVECMQNIRKYGAEVNADGDLKPGIVIVTFKEGAYTVGAGNFIDTADVPALQAKLDAVISLDKEQLKNLHKKTLSETQLSDKSGAGLGLISIARKCNSIRYNFRKLDGNRVFYSLHVRISDNQ